MNILIIEDTAEVRDILILVCKKHGQHEIRTVGTVEDARSAIAGFTPDLVFSDNNLPDGEGPTLFPLIREKNPQVHIVLISGGLEKNTGEGMVSQQIADAFIPKPAPLTIIMQILNERSKRL